MARQRSHEYLQDHLDEMLDIKGIKDSKNEKSSDAHSQQSVDGTTQDDEITAVGVCDNYGENGSKSVETDIDCEEEQEEQDEEQDEEEEEEDNDDNDVDDDDDDAYDDGCDNGIEEGCGEEEQAADEDEVEGDDHHLQTSDDKEMHDCDGEENQDEHEDNLSAKSESGEESDEWPFVTAAKPETTNCSSVSAPHDETQHSKDLEPDGLWYCSKLLCFEKRNSEPRAHHQEFGAVSRLRSDRALQ
eukprot:Selendium_serpulae@DN9434_c0_g1_i1.p1